MARLTRVAESLAVAVDAVVGVVVVPLVGLLVVAAAIPLVAAAEVRPLAQRPASLVFGCQT